MGEPSASYGGKTPYLAPPTNIDYLFPTPIIDHSTKSPHKNYINFIQPYNALQTRSFKEMNMDNFSNSNNGGGKKGQNHNWVDTPSHWLATQKSVPYQPELIAL